MVTLMAIQPEPFFDGEQWNRPAVVAAQRARAIANSERLGRPVSHRNLLSDPLDPVFVEKFERFHGVVLPSDYRSFLIQVGDGGDGPGLYMRPLGAPVDDSAPWTQGDIASGSDEPNGLLAQPFAHVEATDIDPADGDLQTTAGALYLFDHGCALWDLLVVTGDAAGQIWHDRLVDGDGLRPAIGIDGRPSRFAEYYSNWLRSDT